MLKAIGRDINTLSPTLRAARCCSPLEDGPLLLVPSLSNLRGLSAGHTPSGTPRRLNGYGPTPCLSLYYQTIRLRLAMAN